MKHSILGSLVLMGLALTSTSHAALTVVTSTVAFPSSSKELKAYVQKNLALIEKSGAKQLGIEKISLRKDRVDCLGTSSMFSDKKSVGTCLVFGDAGEPNSDAIFSVSIGETESSNEPKISVSVLTYEL